MVIEYVRTRSRVVVYIAWLVSEEEINIITKKKDRACTLAHIF